MSADAPEELAVDVDALRKEVQNKYREVALDPHGAHHFHTGRYLARHLGYDDAFVASLPDAAVESFAGVANPFVSHPFSKGERVVDVGSGGGFDLFVAADLVGDTGAVVGIDMTPEMLAKRARPPPGWAAGMWSSRRVTPKNSRSRTAGPTW